MTVGFATVTSSDVPRAPDSPPPPDVNVIPGFVLVVLATAVLAFVPAALINVAVGRLGSRQPMSWPRLAVLVLLLALLGWVVYAVVAIVVLTLEAKGFIQ